MDNYTDSYTGASLCKYYTSFALINGEELSELLIEEKLAKYRPGGKEEWEEFKSALLRKWNQMADQATKESVDDEDDDLDEDRFDVNFGNEDEKEKAQEMLDMMGISLQELKERVAGSVRSVQSSPRPGDKII